MPVTPTYPGVYIEEVPSGVRTITGVSTSIAAFFGRTEKGSINKAVRCLSYSDFLRNFGGAHPLSDLGASVNRSLAMAEPIAMSSGWQRVRDHQVLRFAGWQTTRMF